MSIKHPALIARLKEQRAKLEVRIQAAEARAKLDERKKDDGFIFNP